MRLRASTSVSVGGAGSRVTAATESCSAPPRHGVPTVREPTDQRGLTGRQVGVQVEVVVEQVHLPRRLVHRHRLRRERLAPDHLPGLRRAGEARLRFPRPVPVPPLVLAGDPRPAVPGASALAQLDQLASQPRLHLVDGLAHRRRDRVGAQHGAADVTVTSARARPRHGRVGAALQDDMGVQEAGPLADQRGGRPCPGRSRARGSPRGHATSPRPEPTLPRPTSSPSSRRAAGPADPAAARLDANPWGQSRGVAKVPVWRGGRPGTPVGRPADAGQSDASPATGPLTLLLCGDVMLGRGIDQVLAHPGDPTLWEAYVHDARGYVELAEAVCGPGRAPGGGQLAVGRRAGGPRGRRPGGPDAQPRDRHHPVLGRRARQGDPLPDEPGQPRLPARRPARRVRAGEQPRPRLRPPQGLAETLDVLHARRSRHAPVPARTSQAGAGARRGGARRHPGRRARLRRTPAAACPGLLGGHRRTGPASHCSRTCRTRRPARVASPRRGGEAARARSWSCRCTGDRTGGSRSRGTRCAFAHRLVDAGADVVHGHSSHHPRPLEVYGGRLVLHGCGDLVNDYEGIEGHEELPRRPAPAAPGARRAHDGALVARRAAAVPVPAAPARARRRRRGRVAEARAGPEQPGPRRRGCVHRTADGTGTGSPEMTDAPVEDRGVSGR